MLFKAALLATLALPPATPTQAEFDRRFSELHDAAKAFALTCVAYGVLLNDLATAMNTEQFLRYSDEQAQPFLRGQPGMVWSAKSNESIYWIVQVDGGPCSMFVQKTDRRAALTDLKKLMQSLYPGGTLSRLPEEESGPNDDRVASDGWSIYDPTTDKTIKMSVNTPKFDNPPFEAIFRTISIDGRR